MMGENEAPVQPQLSLWDAVSIMVGIVIGATIYRMPPLIYSNVANPWAGLGVWALGGALSLVGAFCYAELASTYPRLGGDYVYLTRAFGSWVGFLFGWAQVAILFPAAIGTMVFVFAEYGVNLWDFGPYSVVIYAAAAASVLSLLNILGVVFGKRVQNVLTGAKVLGLGAIVATGLVWGKGGDSWNAEPLPITMSGFGLAMIFVLYAFGGWNDMAFVAAELRDRRNIPRALLLGTLAIAVIYLLVNAAYTQALGFATIRTSKGVAADVLALLPGPLGKSGAVIMSLLVMVSALGAANGLIFTGSRLSATLGADHGIFAQLGRWSPRLGSPVIALGVQWAVTLLLIGVVGSDHGRAAIDSLWDRMGWAHIPWTEKFGGGFEALLSCTAPVFWAFFFLVGVALFVLRFKDAGIERPFALKIPFFPLMPLVFCATCLYMLYKAIDWAEKLSLIGVALLALGVPLYFVSRHEPAIMAPPADESV